MEWQDTISAFHSRWTVTGNLGISEAMMDFAASRAHMVDSQMRTAGVTDHRVLAVFGTIPREDFVPPEQRGIAYLDDDLLIKPGSRAHPPRFLMEPMVLARLVQLANIRPSDKVLHVGCTTGYATAILANLAREVVATDEDAELTEMAGKLLVVQDIRNARVIQAPHALGAMAEAPFDVIVIEGQVPATPAALLDQLADGGRLVAVVGERAMAPAMLYTRHGEATSTRVAFDAAVKRLPGFVVERPAFVF